MVTYTKAGGSIRSGQFGGMLFDCSIQHGQVVMAAYVVRNMLVTKYEKYLGTAVLSLYLAEMLYVATYALQWHC